MGGVALIVFNLSCVCFNHFFMQCYMLKNSVFMLFLFLFPPSANVCVCKYMLFTFSFLVCRYPNTACELLTSDVSQINDKLASDRELVDQLYSFLESERPLNPLLASFFSKVMGLLITRKSEMVCFSVLGRS